MAAREGPSTAVSYDNAPSVEKPTIGDHLYKGYFVVDSVVAAQGNYKAHATGWCEQIIAAVQTAEYVNALDGKDYIVIDAKTGKVVA